jgi:hypothetical protein
MGWLEYASPFFLISLNNNSTYAAGGSSWGVFGGAWPAPTPPNYSQLSNC